MTVHPMGILESLFRKEAPVSEDTAWLRDITQALNQLATDPTHLKHSKSRQPKPKGVDEVRNSLDLLPDPVVSQLLETVSKAAPDALQLRWNPSITRLPEESLSYWQVCNVEYTLGVELSDNHEDIELADWLDPDMRDRIERLIAGVQNYIEAHHTTIPSMLKETLSYAEDLRSSQTLTGPDPDGQRKLEYLQDRHRQTEQDSHSLLHASLEALKALDDEIAECRNLDNARKAAVRVAEFTPQTEQPGNLDSSTITADIEQSKVRAIRLRELADEVRHPATSHGKTRGTSESPLIGGR